MNTRTLALCALLVAVASCREWPEDLVADEQEVLRLVNAAREGGAACPSGTMAAVAPLAWDEQLAWAARLHAADMGEQGYFEHDSLDGRTPFERMEAEGYRGFPRAENLAAGSSRPADAMAQWMSSDGHCRNIMDPEATCLGVGHAVVEGSEWLHYWVQTFGVATP